MKINFDIRTAQPSRLQLQLRYIFSIQNSNCPGLMFNKFVFRSLILSALGALFVSVASAQARNPVDSGLVQQQGQLPAPDDGTWMYTVGFSLFFIVCIGVLLWMRSKKKAEATAAEQSKGLRKKDSWDSDAIEGDKELEWLRKNNDTINRKRRKKPLSKPAVAKKVVIPEPVATKEIQLTSALELPFNSILRLEYPGLTETLPSSNAEDLQESIEQVLDEFNDDDEEIKELSMRIIAAYKTSNSVEALTQVALYDLSSNNRCRAIEILGDFGHETVFEPVILACGDPTREVRAAAAKVLTRLNFNRSDAWARISLLNEEMRMRQVARAAIEGGLVERYFDRLTHKDYKQAYEAFALFTLLLKARETETIATALESHPSSTVRVALLHVIKVNRERESLKYLMKLAERKDLPKDVWEAVEDAISIFSPEGEEVEAA
jgi:HEAT repeats